jgi:tRNA nucleotidyltransferase (CCA-adding enzyme)
MSIDPPRAVRDIVRQLERAGFEAWCVGGAVRDALMGVEHLDWDIATSAEPARVRRIFRNTVPIGIEFGTVGVLDGSGVMHEVTTFRRDVETDGRHARVAFGVSLEEDLARRDFTINAIAYSPTRDAVFDPFDGQGDIARRMLRTVGNPDERMAEDRLRALRALRFAARFAFTIDPPTWTAVGRSSEHLARLSAERIRQEIEKTMDQVATPSSAFLLWRECGAFARVLPALAGASDVELSFADCLAPPRAGGPPARRVNRITAIMLGAGPGSTRRTLRELRFSNSIVSWIDGQVEKWSAESAGLEAALAAGRLPAPAFARRWIARVGRPRTGALLRVCFSVWGARRAAGREAPPPELCFPLYGRLLRSAFRDAIERADLSIDGEDLLALGIGPGPVIGRVLDALVDRVIDDPLANSRQGLLRIAAQEFNGDAGRLDRGGGVQ